MIPMNQYPASSVVPIFFTTYGKTNGESITLTGLAVTDIEIYKGTSTTQRSSDAGYALIDTDGIDVDGVTGVHGFSIDLGDNTDAGFYAVGSFYTVVVSAVTIDSQTVNFIADRFRIVAAEAITGKPKVDVDGWLGTAAATPTTNGVPEVDVTHWLGTACATPTVNGVPEVDLTHVAGSTTDVSTIPASVAAILVDTGTTLQGELDGIQADTEDIQTRLPAALTGNGFIQADAIRINSILPTMGASLTFPTSVASPTNITAGTITTATNVTTVNGLAANVITATSIAADAITAAKIATGAVDADALAADAVAEIQLGLATQTSVDTIDDLLDTEIAALTTAVADLPTNAELATALGTADDAVLAAIAALNNLSAAQVNAEVVDALATDTYAEPGQEAPGATVSLSKKIGYLYKLLRNKITQTATTLSIYDDAGTTVDQKATVSDDATTYTRGEIGTGP